MDVQHRNDSEVKSENVSLCFKNSKSVNPQKTITNARFGAVNRAVSTPENDRKIKILSFFVGIVYGIGFFVIFPVVSILVI